MTMLATILLAETILAAPAETATLPRTTPGRDGVPPPSAAPATEVLVEAASKGGGASPRSVKVTSDRATYLRKEGVIAFEGNVFVDDEEFKMHAREVSLFLEGTNTLKRVVAIGDVAVTNGVRSGSCAKATYNKALSKVVLYGDAKTGVTARLRDDGRRKSEVEGRKITFWIDTEQVEVEGSTVTVDASGLDAKEGAKSLLGR